MGFYFCDGGKKGYGKEVAIIIIDMLHQAVSWDARVTCGIIKALYKEAAPNDFSRFTPFVEYYCSFPAFSCLLAILCFSEYLKVDKMKKVG